MDKVIGFLKPSGHAITSSVSRAKLVECPFPITQKAAQYFSHHDLVN